MASQSLPVLKRLGMSFLILYIHWISNRSYRVCGLARISDEVGVWKGSAVASTAVGEEQNYVPVVIWHGTLNVFDTLSGGGQELQSRFVNMMMKF